jgi:tetratricopeptide (TPR) repeat protein
MTYGNMGNVYEQLGRLEKALEMHEQCLDIMLKSLGDSHVDVAKTYCNIGNVYLLQGKLEKALEMFKKDLEITRNALGDSHASAISRPGGTAGWLWNFRL